MSTLPSPGRCLAAAAGCLLLGSALAVAMAWACVLWGPYPSDPVGLRPFGARQGSIHRIHTTWAMDVLHGWSDTGPPPSELRFAQSLSAGVPARCLRSRHDIWTNDTGTFEAWSGLPLPRWCDRLIGPVRWEGSRLPLTILWPGFVLNTLAYAAASAACLYAVHHARRRVRVRRGLCPGCAYSRAGLAPHAACPECGSPGRAPRNRI